LVPPDVRITDVKGLEGKTGEGKVNGRKGRWGDLAWGPMSCEGGPTFLQRGPKYMYSSWAPNFTL